MFCFRLLVSQQDNLTKFFGGVTINKRLYFDDNPGFLLLRDGAIRKQ